VVFVVDTYAGKTDRELLVEIYTTLQDNCGIIEDHECRIAELQKEANQAKGALLVISGVLSLFGLKIVGVLKGLGL
jgi:hypothetical protein